MKHELVPNDPVDDVFDLRAFSRDAVIRGIMGAVENKSLMKERVMLAYQYRVITPREVRAFIKDYGLKHA